MHRKEIKEKILGSDSTEEKISLACEFKNSDKENELLFFLKPEFFYFESINHTEPILDLIFKKIDQFKIDINGVVILKGKFLKDSNIIEKHYGFINKMSVNGSKIIKKSDKEKIKTLLRLGSLDDYKILGGHEAMQFYQHLDENALQNLWYFGDATRIGEGFYVQAHRINNDDVILINGFHPSQIKHYTGSESKIVLFLLNTDTDWKIIRNDFVGDTYPEKANKGSVRAALFKNAEKFRIKKINVANNFVHASSGPFDALFEICNFVGNIEGINYCRYNTNIYYIMTQKYDLSDDDYERCLSNPKARVDDIQTDLYTLTKNKNTHEAVMNYIKYFKNNKTVLI